METLGPSSVPSSLVYLGKGRVFVGSSGGDSQFSKILDRAVPLGGNGGYDSDNEGEKEVDPLEETTKLRVLEEYTNLGPIV